MKFVIVDFNPTFGFETFFMSKKEQLEKYPEMQKEDIWIVEQYYPLLNVCSSISLEDEEILNWYFINQEEVECGRVCWVRETATKKQKESFLAECTGTCPKIIMENQGFCQEEYFV